MGYKTIRRRVWSVFAVGLGTAFILGGCDPTIQATVENGIITSANAALGSLFQAGLQLANESLANNNNANANNNSNGNTP